MDALTVDWGSGGPWLPAYGLIGDSGLYLPPQCVLLETILEEDDEYLSDEDQSNGWDEPRGGWGSDSDTQSVIHVDLCDDANDSGSERDFICPPKRRKHDTNSDVSNNRYRNFPDQFENEFHFTSDEDSLSFNSLSRSSSLLQFESLERQFQQDVHSSTPSIVSQFSFDSLEKHEKDSKICPDSLEVYENGNHKYETYISSSRSMENISTYHSRDNGFVENSDSDSEFSEPRSSDGDGDSDATVQLNSGSNSFRSKHRVVPFRSFENLSKEYIDRKCDSEEISKTIPRRFPLRDQRSAENLSEDSGYCDTTCNFMKLKSKSIPCFKLQFSDKPLIKKSLKRKSADSLNIVDHKTSKNCEFSRHFGPEGTFQQKRSPFEYHSYENINYVQPKSSLKRKNRETASKGVTAHVDFQKLDVLRSDLNMGQNPEINILMSVDEVDNVHGDREWRNQSSFKNNLTTVMSASSPTLTSEIVWSDLFSLSEDKQFDEIYNNARSTFPKSDFERNLDRLCLLNNTYRDIHSESFEFRLKDSVCVTSVPKDLNLCVSEDKSVANYTNADEWSFSAGNDSVAAKNFDLYDFSAEPAPHTYNSFIDDFTTSCADLTALDFSDSRSNFNKYKMDRYKLTNNVHKNDSSSSLNRSGKQNTSKTLFDEISANFDKDLSILTDRHQNYDSVNQFLESERQSSIKVVHLPRLNKPNESEQQPERPERQERQERQVEIKELSSPPSKRSTFDLDPTNLVTCYTESLERCTFDIDDAINKSISNTNVNCSATELQEKFFKNEMFYHSTPKRNMVASTPNLNTCNSDNDFVEKIHKEELRSSMQHVPIKNEPETTRPGILGSKNQSSNSVGAKGVHFCPVVSEVSWRERSYSDEIHSNDETASYHSNDSEFSKSDSSEDDIENNVTVVRSEDYKNITQNPEYVLIQPNSVPVLKTSKISIELRPPIYNSENSLQLKSQDSPLVKNEAADESDRGDTSGVTIPRARQATQQQQQLPALSNPITIPITPATSSANTNLAESKENAHVSVVQPVVNTKMDPTKTDSKMSAVFEKPAKKGGFLSRFTNFRFSSRKNNNDSKKKCKSKDNVSADVPKIIKESKKDNKEVDYIFIPLKGPVANPKDNTAPNIIPVIDNSIETQPNQKVEQLSTSVCPSEVLTVSDSLNLSRDSDNSFDMQTKNISSKPPLPKLPPRIVGVCAKRQKSDSAPYKNHLTTLNNIDSRNGVPVPVPVLVNSRKLSNIEYGHNTMDSNIRMGLIETDLDTHETVVCNGKARSLIDLGLSEGVQHPKRSGGPPAEPPRPHKSMEFLLDKENHKEILPPENELQKTTSMSEHQLRVQRSLQKLNVPDWYKNSQVPREGFLLKKRNSDAGSYHPPSTRWTGLNSKTTSLNSLGSQKSDRSPGYLLSPSTTREFSRWSTSKLNSTQTSPSASVRSSFSCRSPVSVNTGIGHHGGTVGACGQGSLRGSFRQPYLGWRSQEKLSRPRTPAERLATSILPSQDPIQNPEIQSSIKEVTSAIVHYVSGAADHDGSKSRDLNSRLHHDEHDSLTPRFCPEKRDFDNVSQRSRSGSPKLCWLESSFVGTKPLDSPQTPIITKNFDHTTTNLDHRDLKLELTNNTDYKNNVMCASPAPEARQVTPGSATLEDVLASLLGLRPMGPSSQRASSGALPADMDVASTSTLPKLKRPPPLSIARSSDNRRKSEGDTSTSGINASRRSSLNVTPTTIQPPEQNEMREETMVKCRYTKCTKTATPVDAKKHFKNCHNCNYVYCSRECRRAHWEKHRKICLHSRVSALCRQIINSCKDDQVTLKHISMLAKQGYLSHGRGVVKVMFKSPESAENFVKNGFQKLGDISYIKWPDLTPTEMGPELYSELLRLCMAYNSEVKFVLYVSVCVVSEVPTSGAVKWERQLVSRCAKLKLCKTIADSQSSSKKSSVNITREMESPETVILTSLIKTQNTPKTRENAFANIQKHLRQKGVNLKRHFPEVFLKLCSYVENGGEKFVPVTIYPKDQVTGKSFMCIIMPEVDREKLHMLPTDTTRVKVVDISLNLDID